MTKFTKPAFQVSGFKVTISNQKDSQAIIKLAWQKFMHEGLHKKIENIAYPQVIAVYYNFTNLFDPIKEGYDMLLGYNTVADSVQSNPDFVTIQIPTQDYKYVDFEGDFEKLLPLEWKKVNNMPISEVNRSHQFDLEIYSEDYKTCTIAVGIQG